MTKRNFLKTIDKMRGLCYNYYRKKEREETKMRNYYWDNDFDRAFDEAVDEMIKKEREAKANGKCENNPQTAK